MKFQRRPRTQPSQIIIPVRLLDKENLVQQEALGIVGVNLIYGAFFHYGTQFITSLLDGVTAQRVEVDLIEFSGPAFQMLDNRLMALELVRYSLTSAAMFTANGEVVQAAEVLYKKAILVERGSFRPVTRVTLDMLNVARARFVQEPLVQGEPILELMEMTLKNLSDEGVIDLAARLRSGISCQTMWIARRRQIQSERRALSTAVSRSGRYDAARASHS